MIDILRLKQIVKLSPPKFFFLHNFFIFASVNHCENWIGKAFLGLRNLKRELEKKRIIDDQSVLCNGTACGNFFCRMYHSVFYCRNKWCLLRKHSNKDVVASIGGKKLATHLCVYYLVAFKQNADRNSWEKECMVDSYDHSEFYRSRVLLGRKECLLFLEKRTGNRDVEKMRNKNE